MIKWVLTCLLVFCLGIPTLAAPAALQVESSLAGYLDNSGKILANGTIAFYTSDAYSSYKTVYSDASKTTAVSQPISLNSSGIPVDGVGNPIAIFADGVYWMRLKSSTGATIRSYKSVTYQGAIDFGGLYVDVASTYGRTDSALTSALAAYSGGSQVTFLFNSGEFINSSARSLPSNVKFLFVNGAYLTNSGALIAPNIWEFQSNSYISNSSTISFTNGANLIDTLGSTLQGSGAYTGNFRAPMFATNEVYVPGQYASINLAIAAINKSTGVSWNIVLVGASPLTATVSIPVNVKKIMSRSGYITGVGQITFTGQYLDCPPNEHLFRGSVSVTGDITNTEFHPEWFGAIGDGVSDDADILNLVATFIRGKKLLLNNTYMVNSTVYFRNNNNQITGTGTIKSSGTFATDRHAFEISGSNNEIYSLTFSGLKSGGIGIRGSKNTVRNCLIENGAQGGISIISKRLSETTSANFNIIKNNIILNVTSNGILVYGDGADNNLIDGNLIDKTTNQNCIFITYITSGVRSTTANIYNNVIVNNICKNAGDTGIESGRGTRGTIIANNSVEANYNPGILARDSIHCSIVGNSVQFKNTYIYCSGISVSRQTFTGYDDAGDTLIANNTIWGTFGNSFNSGIKIDMPNVKVIGNRVIQGDPLTNFPTKTGFGVSVAPSTDHITIENNDFSGVSIGISFNPGVIANAGTNNYTIVKNNKFRDNKYGLIIKGVVFENSRFLDNTFENIASYNYFADGAGTKLRYNTVLREDYNNVIYNLTATGTDDFFDLTEYVSTVNMPVIQNDVVDLVSSVLIRDHDIFIKGQSVTENVFAHIKMINGTPNIVIANDIGNIGITTEPWRLKFSSSKLQLERYDTTTYTRKPLTIIRKRISYLVED